MSKDLDFGHQQGQDRALTVMSFGPYDNTFVLLGFSDGVVVGLDPATLHMKFMHKVSQFAVTSIVVDPLCSFLIGCQDGSFISLTLEKSQVKYVYLEFGGSQFATVELKQPKNLEAKYLEIKTPYNEEEEQMDTSVEACILQKELEK